MIPRGFLFDTDEPITVDEAQKCPEILTAIKRKVDKREWQDDFYCPALANFSPPQRRLRKSCRPSGLF